MSTDAELSGDFLTLQPGKVDLATLRRIYEGTVKLRLCEKAWVDVGVAHRSVRHLAESGEAVYGINTGFGKLAGTRIGKDQLEALQENLVLSHCAGVGKSLPDGVVRLILATKIISLARGFSGVGEEVIKALLVLYNAGAVPQIPGKGSVGASGDLAPLAHLACVLLGQGCVKLPGRPSTTGAADALGAVGLAPLRLGPKEGLALLNGTQVSNALAMAGLFEAEKVYAAGLLAGALSLEAIRGSVGPFDARIHEARGQRGQIAVASAMRALLADSEIIHNRGNCPRVQDPYSVRCIPQVMGACMDNLEHAARVLVVEANAASDNPLVFPDTGEAVCGGNFHAEPVAFAADIIALAVAEIGAISERRLALLLDSGMSGLPPFLVPQSGLNSGFMIAQVTAARLRRRTNRWPIRQAWTACRRPRTRKITCPWRLSRAEGLRACLRTRRRSWRSRRWPRRRGSSSTGRCAAQLPSKKCLPTYADTSNSLSTTGSWLTTSMP